MLQVTRWLIKHGTIVRIFKVSMDSAIYHWSTFRRGIVGLLAHMSNLQQLTVHDFTGFMDPAYDMYAIQYLTRLENLYLSCSCHRKWAPDTLQPLSGLKNLSRLSMDISDMSTPLLIHSSLSCLTGLTCFDFSRAGAKRSQALHGIDTHNVINVVSNLTGLRSLDVHGMIDMLPASLLSLQQLSCLWYHGARFSYPAIASMPGWDNLETIYLGCIPQVEQGAWQSFCRQLSILPKLSRFILDKIDLSNIQTQDWALSTRLTSLTFMNTRVSALPSSIEHLVQLDELSLVEPRLLDLKLLIPLIRRLRKLKLMPHQAMASHLELRDATCVTQHPWLV